jgi:hypothetical protein
LELIQKHVIPIKTFAMLCHICIGVLQHTNNVIDSSTEDHLSWLVCAHHPTVSTLATSAADGCHVCQPFWSQLSKSEQEILYLEESKDDTRMSNSGEGKDNQHGRLTHITLHTNRLREGDYYFSVRFDHDYIDWTRVSKKKDEVVISMYNLQPVQSMHPDRCTHRQLAKLKHRYGTSGYRTTPFKQYRL